MRKRFTMTVTVTAPASMPARAVRNEVRARISEVCYFYAGYQFKGLRLSDFNSNGNGLRLTVAKLTPAKEGQADV